MGQYLMLLSAPVLGIFYAIGDHFKIWDKLTGRDKAKEGLDRLRSGAGYPVSVIYRDSKDLAIFLALYNRILKNSKCPHIKPALRAGKEFSVIATLGLPTEVAGLTSQWPQHERFYYSEYHPIVMTYDAVRDATKNSDSNLQGKGFIACTIRDLDGWLRKEEIDRKFYVGSLMIGLLSISLIVLRASGV